MRTWTRSAAASGIAAMAGMCVLLCLSGCGGNEQAEIEMQRATQEETAVFPATEQPRLVVETASGDITIRADGSDDAIRVTATLRAEAESLEAATTRVEELSAEMVQDGDTITLRFDADPDVAVTGAVDFDVTLPARTAIDATSGGGSIAVFDTTSSVKARTARGDLEIHISEGLVDAETEAGDILFVGQFESSLDNPTEHRLATQDGLIEAFLDPTYFKLEATAPNGKISAEELYFFGGRSDTRWSLMIRPTAASSAGADRPPNTKVFIHNETGDIRLVHIDVYGRMPTEAE